MTVFLSTRLHVRQQIGLSPKTHRRRFVPPPVGSGRRAGLERAARRSGPAELVVRDEAGRTRELIGITTDPVIANRIARVVTQRIGERQGEM
jgi:hypothetical protein